MLSVFNQSNFPRLWQVFQRLIGGTLDKQKFAIMYYGGQQRVLEIGCSVGNVSEIFSQFKNISFTGIDIDDNALSLARDRLGYLSNFKFENTSLSEIASRGDKYDYVLFANILHHVDDVAAVKLLSNASDLLMEDSVLIIMEPEKSRKDYNFLFRLFYLLERGRYRRHMEELLDLVRESGLAILNSEEVLVSPDSLPIAKVGRTLLIKTSLRSENRL